MSPLSVWGLFSYFPSIKPSIQDLQGEQDVYILTLATWNPHSDTYTSDEDSMLDWEGNMKERKDWHHNMVLEEVEDDNAMVAPLQVSEEEHKVIDETIVENDMHISDAPSTSLHSVAPACNQVSSVLLMVSLTPVSHLHAIRFPEYC